MNKHHLDETLKALKGPTSAQITVNNQWAAVAFDKFHLSSTTTLNTIIDAKSDQIELSWDSNFSKVAMKDEIYMAYHGGEALAMFVMSVLCNYKYAEQSEIGTGVDYRFREEEPKDDDLNFLDDFHYVEVSGLLRESKTNTLIGRIKQKHAQIDAGGKKEKPSSVIVTQFKEPKTVKEKHK